MSAAAPQTIDVRDGRPRATVIDMILRFALGALFIVSATAKLRMSLDFAFAIKAFHLGIPENAIVFLAYAIPWFEALIGAGLILRIWVRPAALLSGLLMLGFIAGIVSLILRGKDVTCPCFGSLKLICTGPMGLCHIVRNLIITLVSFRIVQAYRPRASA